jgi:hypothetical protein
MAGGNAPRPRLVVIERRHRVAALYLQGEHQYAIAARVGVSQQQVSFDLKAMRLQWLAATLRDFDAAKAEELARIDAIEVEAWQAWARSKEPREVTTTEGIEGGAGAGQRISRKAIVRREEQCGDPRFLERIQKCIEQRCTILGLNPPQKVAPTTPDGTQPWEGTTGLATLLEAATRTTSHGTSNGTHHGTSASADED